MNLKKLEGLIEEKAISKTAIAEKLAISRPSLYMKLAGDVKFTNDECCSLALILGMTEREIIDTFFTDYVRKYAN